jgi:cobalamin 5'-phosphate synthase/cobalamin synthase
MNRLREVWRYWLIAISFLTCLPVPAYRYQSGDLARAALFFPLVGAFIGGVNYGTFRLLRWAGASSYLTGLAVVTMGLVLTRGLHLDGWADICDGLFTTKEAEKRREILKDSHLGTFGVVGIVLLLGFKTVAIGETINPWILMVAPVAGRTASLIIGSFFYPFTREKRGLGEEFLGRVPGWYVWFWLGVVLILPSWRWGALFFPQAAAGFIIGWLFGKMMERSFQGLNGDAVGATIETVETLFLFMGGGQR